MHHFGPTSYFGENRAIKMKKGKDRGEKEGKDVVPT
jgi:hypothetical protein